MLVLHFLKLLVLIFTVVLDNLDQVLLGLLGLRFLAVQLLLLLVLKLAIGNN